MKKYKKTIVGFSLLLLLFLVSCLYPLYGPADYDKEMLVRNEAGEVIDRAPSPPSLNHLMGTDRNGQDNLLLLVDGAKYTLGITFLIAFLRVLLGMVSGVVLEVWLPMCKKLFGDFFLCFRYVPSLIIAVLLMIPFVGSYSVRPIVATIVVQAIILTIVAYPTLTLMTADYVGELMTRSFVHSSKLMGASKGHIVHKHLKPYLTSFGLLMFVQQAIQTLIILTHLGVFGLFLGGQTKSGIFGIELNPPEPSSIYNEWSGLIGQNYIVFIQFPWIVLSTILGFFVLIVVLNMIKRELESQLEYAPPRKKKAAKGAKPSRNSSKLDKAAFQRVNGEGFH